MKTVSISISIFSTRTIVLVLISLLFSTAAYSGTKTWYGTANTNWNNASNWTNSSLPEADDEVIIPACSPGGKMPVISTGNIHFKKLTIEHGGTLLQTGGTIIPGEKFLVSGSFIQEGGIITSENYLVISSGGSFESSLSISAKKLIVEENGHFKFNGQCMRITEYIENFGKIEFGSGKIKIDKQIKNSKTGIIIVNNANIISDEEFKNEGLFTINSGSFDVLSAGKKITIERGIFNHFGGFVSAKDIEVKKEGTYNQTGGELIIYHDMKIDNEAIFNATGGTVHFTGLQGDGSEYYGNVQFYNVIIDSSAALKLSDNKDYIRIAGDFSNNNSNLDNEKGTIEFNGTSEQLIYSASSPASSKTLAAIIIIKSNSHITLLSDLGVKSDVELETGGTISLNGNDLYKNGSVYDGPTPVELVSFSASVKVNVVTLSWKTVTELNNYGFEIERSIDSKDWNKIGFVNGFGNSTSAISYSFEDSKVSNNTYYYRLKQVDFDGSFTYSSTAAINFEQIPNKFELYQNYPNPFNPSTKIKYAVSSESFVSIKVYNILGSEVATLVNENLPAGVHEVNFDGSELSSGAYIYKIQTKDFTSTKKMVLNK